MWVHLKYFLGNRRKTRSEVFVCVACAAASSRPLRMSFDQSRKQQQFPGNDWNKTSCSMASASDPFTSLPTEIKVINRLSSGLCRAGRRDEPGTGRVTSQKPVALAPFRDDVPLLDPCSGHLSAGARVQLGIQSRTEFIDPFRKRPQTTPSLSG